MSTIRWPTTITTRIRIHIHVLTLTIMLTLCGVDYNSKSLFYTLKICCELIFSYRNKIHEFFNKKWRNQIPCVAISNGFKTTQTETQKFNHSNRETVALPTTSTQCLENNNVRLSLLASRYNFTTRKMFAGNYCCLKDEEGKNLCALLSHTDRKRISNDFVQFKKSVWERDSGI